MTEMHFFKFQSYDGDAFFQISVVSRDRTFLPLRSNPHIFYCDECTAARSPVYRPLVEDIMINVRKYDQISFLTAGVYFIADTTGDYAGNRNGE